MLNRLPRDLLNMIMCYLNETQMVALMGTCRRLHTVGLVTRRHRKGSLTLHQILLEDNVFVFRRLQVFRHGSHDYWIKACLDYKAIKAFRWLVWVKSGESELVNVGHLLQVYAQRDLSREQLERFLIVLKGHPGREQIWKGINLLRWPSNDIQDIFHRYLGQP